MHPGSINDHGWNALAYDSVMRIKAQSKDIDIVRNQVADASRHEAALRSMAVAGARMVIGHGFEFTKPALAVAVDFPDTAFIVSAGDGHRPR